MLICPTGKSSIPNSLCRDHLNNVWTKKALQHFITSAISFEAIPTRWPGWSWLQSCGRNSMICSFIPDQQWVLKQHGINSITRNLTCLLAGGRVYLITRFIYVVILTIVLGPSVYGIINYGVVRYSFFSLDQHGHDIFSWVQSYFVSFIIYVQKQPSRLRCLCWHSSLTGCDAWSRRTWSCVRNSIHGLPVNFLL